MQWLKGKNALSGWSCDQTFLLVSCVLSPRPHYSMSHPSQPKYSHSSIRAAKMQPVGGAVGGQRERLSLLSSTQHEAAEHPYFKSFRS